MKNIERMKMIQNTYGLSTRKEIEFEKQKRFVNKHFEDTTATENDIVIWNSKRCRTQDLVVMKTRQNAEDPNTKKIMSRPNESFNVGEFVKCYGENWIITKSDSNDHIYTTGQMTLCPNTLKFQDSAGKIHSYPYFVDVSLPNIDENKIIQTSITTRKIRLPFDNLTKEFFIDKRFMGEVFGGKPHCWIVRDLDAERNKGLLIVTLGKTLFCPDTDDIERGVCDYFEQGTTPNPKSLVEIVYSDKAELKAGGSYKTFNVVFRDSNGNELNGMEAAWTVTPPNGFEEDIAYVIDGNQIEIKAGDMTDIIGKYIVLSVSDTVDTGTSIEIKIVPLF